MGHLLDISKRRPETRVYWEAYIHSAGFELFKFFDNSIVDELTFKNSSFQRMKKNFKGFNYGEVIFD